MKGLLSIVLLFVVFHCRSQEFRCSALDSTAIHEKLGTVAYLKNEDPGKTMVAIGKTFLEAPYVAKTLEIGASESLVINVREFDCTTYVENVLAFSLLLHRDRLEFNAFLKVLEEIRYRDGNLKGYASRLHYFSDWIVNNEKKGLVTDVTGKLGGSEIIKTIDFMGSHRELYPRLAKDEQMFVAIRAIEKELLEQSLCILPQEAIEVNEQLIHNGDIIALTTGIKGLDVTHTGIATREADGRIHLLHAGTGQMKVGITKKPLADYLKGIRNNTGIIVVRVAVPD